MPRRVEGGVYRGGFAVQGVSLKGGNQTLWGCTEPWDKLTIETILTEGLYFMLPTGGRGVHIPCPPGGWGVQRAGHGIKNFSSKGGADLFAVALFVEHWDKLTSREY